MAKLKDLTGQVFGRWTVVSRAENKGSHRYWDCLCACGKQKSVYQGSLDKGVSTSCGCQRDEETSRRNFKHGVCDGCHTKQPPRTYNCWRNMKARCSNPNNHKWPVYGGRGISVCERWQTFSSFYADMGDCPEGHSIERIDNDGNYEPSNCRWANSIDQMNNQSTNTLLTHNGKTQTLSQWAREVGIHHTTILQRINRGGWSVDRALTEGVQFGPRSLARD